MVPYQLNDNPVFSVFWYNITCRNTEHGNGTGMHNAGQENAHFLALSIGLEQEQKHKNLHAHNTGSDNKEPGQCADDTSLFWIKREIQGAICHKALRHSRLYPSNDRFHSANSPADGQTGSSLDPNVRQLSPNRLLINKPWMMGNILDNTAMQLALVQLADISSDRSPQIFPQFDHSGSFAFRHVCGEKHSRQMGPICPSTVRTPRHGNLPPNSLICFRRWSECQRSTDSEVRVPAMQVFASASCHLQPLKGSHICTWS